MRNPNTVTRSIARRDIKMSEVERLHSLGYSLRRIAIELGCSKECVWKRIKEIKEHEFPVDSLAPLVIGDEKSG
jgi:biotin operon repressor